MRAEETTPPPGIRPPNFTATRPHARARTLRWCVVRRLLAFASGALSRHTRPAQPSSRHNLLEQRRPSPSAHNRGRRRLGKRGRVCEHAADEPHKENTGAEEGETETGPKGCRGCGAQKKPKAELPLAWPQALVICSNRPSRAWLENRPADPIRLERPTATRTSTTHVTAL